MTPRIVRWAPAIVCLFALLAIGARIALPQAVQNPSNPTSNPNQINVTNSYLYLNKLHYAGTYSSAVSYSSQDLVISASLPYISLAPANLNNTPASSPAQWFPLPAGVASAAWGSITGTLSAQTDLNTALGLATNASNIVSGTLNHARLPALVSGDIPANAANTSGNAATATALAATPTLCSTGQAPTGILASGNATGCAATSSAFPLVIVQEGGQAYGNATSFLYTLPTTAASSGNTLFIFMAGDNTNFPAAPSGWTRDLVNGDGNYSKVALFHKASAADTSVTFATGGTASLALKFMEVSGTHALDQSAAGHTGTNPIQVLAGSLTPSVGAAVFVVVGDVPNIAPLPQTSGINPLWTPLCAYSGAAGADARTLFGWTYVGKSAGTAVQPPGIDLSGAGFFGTSGAAWITLSIL